MPFALDLANATAQRVADSTAAELRLHSGNPGPLCADFLIADIPPIDVTGKFAAASGGAVASLADIESIPLPSAQTVSHVSIWDVSGAEPFRMYYGPSNAPRSIAQGDIWRAQAGALIITNATA